ncbi:hypothetical protein [Pedobacter sp. NJ-S-72]
MQALDYHIARMLGLGFIDTPASVGMNDQFIYQLSYTNRKSLDDSKQIDYTYTSLPISKAEKLAPEKPKMRPLLYKFLGGDEGINTSLDENGYSKVDNVRIVNIGRVADTDEMTDYDFFSDLTQIENLNVFEHPKSFFMVWNTVLQINLLM